MGREREEQYRKQRLKRFSSSSTALRIRPLGLVPWLCLWTPFTLVQTTELMGPCISTASELDSLPSSSSLFCPFLYYSTIHTISLVLLPPHLFMPITNVADTWLDSPLSTPSIAHQSYKQVSTQLQNSRSSSALSHVAQSHCMMVAPP